MSFDLYYRMLEEGCGLKLGWLLEKEEEEICYYMRDYLSKKLVVF